MTKHSFFFFKQKNGDGLLDFREFLISFSIFSKALENTEETLKLAFSVKFFIINFMFFFHTVKLTI